MASQCVTVQWIRPKRYEGVIEIIARSRIRGKVDAGGETRAMWRGKAYKVKILDIDGYLSQENDTRRKSPPKKPRTPEAKSPTTKLTKNKRDKERVGVHTGKRKAEPVTATVLKSSTLEPVPSNNTRHRASRRESITPASPMRGAKPSVVVFPQTKTERPPSTQLTVTAVIEPDSSSAVVSTPRSIGLSNSTTPGRDGPFKPPLNLLEPSVARYLKDLENRVVRMETLYKALKPAK